ncbi:hypothetical protein [Mycobacterium phage WXIN]|nr:hypothetical protein [Mycobacterium phage WXIN]
MKTTEERNTAALRMSLAVEVSGRVDESYWVKAEAMNIEAMAEAFRKGSAW